MKVDIEPNLFAIGTLIVCEDKFAVITEKNTSRRSVKVEGQESFPMETVEACEDDLATLGRACREEVCLNLTQILGDIICLNTVQTRPGVELRNYKVEVPIRESVGSGMFTDEVSPVKWVPLDEVIASRGELRFRPGVYETVADYYRWRADPKGFQPGEHFFDQLMDQIPETVFRLIEEGFSGKEAVSRWNLLRQHARETLVSGRLQYGQLDRLGAS